MPDEPNEKLPDPAALVPELHERLEPIAEKLPFQGGFPVFLARYVIFREEGPRAALRFFNASDIVVTGIRFTFRELNGRGEVLSERTVDREGLFAENGGEFAVADIAVDRACERVEVKVERVLSDGYVYDVEKDGVRLRFGREEKGEEKSFLHKPTYSASKKFKKYVIGALLAVIGFVAAAGFLALQFGMIRDAKWDTRSASVGSVMEYEA